MRTGKDILQTSVSANFADRLNYVLTIDRVSNKDLAEALDVSLDWLVGLVKD